MPRWVEVRQIWRRLLAAPQAGLLGIILALSATLTAFAGTYRDRLTGETMSAFMNPGTLMQVATDTSFFAIMAVGATCVIISGGVDLSIGSIYALAGVLMTIAMRGPLPASPLGGLVLCTGIGVACGLFNGLLVSRLGVHPFIVTLGTMWIFRGIAFVVSHAESILVPESFSNFARASLGLRPDLHPVPLVFMTIFAIAGAVLLGRTVWGRRVFAVGGNLEASRYSGVPVHRVLMLVYVFSGFSAGLAAFLGSSFYGASMSGDAQGYELYVIAAAVVGGASLAGGRGSAFGAVLGALLIMLIRQSISTLGLDRNYELIIIGGAVIVAVVADRFGSRLIERRLTQQFDQPASTT